MADHSRHVVAVLLSLVVATVARAEVGNGIRLGGSEGRLHPFLELQGGYDSNVYNAAGSAAAVGDIVLHIRPGLTLNVPSEVAAFDLSANLDWAQYLGNKDKDTKDLSQLYAAAKLGLSVNAKGMVGLQVDDQFRRSDRPAPLTASSGLIATYNALDVHVPIKPGGGALTVMLSGNWTMEGYKAPFKGYDCTIVFGSPCDASSVSKLGYNEISGGGGVAWRFLPRTSVLVEANYFQRLPNDKQYTLLKADPAGYRGLLGLTGLITPRLTTTVKAGYGATSGVTPSLGTWLAILEGEWVPGETTSVKATYGHDFGVDPSTPAYQTHRVTLSGRQLVAGRVSLGLRLSLDMLSYEGLGGGSTNVTQVAPNIGYEVARWLRSEVALTYSDRSSSTAVAARIPDFSRTEAWLKLVATY